MIDLQAQPKRRRIRKHNSKKKFKNPSNIPVEQAELEKQQSILQEKLQPHSHSHTDGPTISKNKKRKLKKKQQIKRKKAAGLLTGVSGVNFMYQPEETSSEQGDVRVSDGEDGADGEGGGPDAEEEGATDAGKEDVKSTNEKADGILNFLKSTQEIYFYDGMFFPVVLLNNGIYFFGKLSKCKILKCLKYKTLKIFSIQNKSLVLRQKSKYLNSSHQRSGLAPALGSPGETASPLEVWVRTRVGSSSSFL